MYNLFAISAPPLETANRVKCNMDKRQLHQPVDRFRARAVVFSGFWRFRHRFVAAMRNNATPHGHCAKPSDTDETSGNVAIPARQPALRYGHARH